MGEDVFFGGWGGLGRTLVVGALAYGALVFMLRISGKRTLSKMNAFDLVVTVALGSTLATVLLNRSVPLAEGVVALGLLIALQFGITWASVRRERFQALVTDGRVSGASGKVPAAIHVTPEALDNGAIGRVRNGDIIRLDLEAGTLEALVEPCEFEARNAEPFDLPAGHHGMGRELFAGFRQLAGRADAGAAVF